MKSIKLLNLLFLITVYVSDVHTSVDSTIFDISDAKELFTNFINTFDKHYKNVAEYQKRFSIFVEHLKEVNQRNSRNDSVVFGITSVFDLAIEEFVGGCLTEIPLARSTSIDKSTSMNQKMEPLKSAPESWDWRRQGAVTQIKSQGPCGSCWAFSAIGCLEGQHAIKYGALLALSDQQFLDCSSSSSCNGGWPQDAFQSAIKAGGVMLESDYPYSAEKGYCAADVTRSVVRPIEAKMAQDVDEEWLKRLVYNYGPVSAVLHFSGAFLGYRGGIANNDNMNCYNRSPNHAIVIVGYGEDRGTPYWIIKNSHGQGWGENGYFKLHRGSNACGISSYIATVEIE